jgi:periplasmic protein TonB
LGEGPRNAIASLPSIASAERRFIPAAGAEGKAFEAMVLSAIREAIFFPKQAVKERHHGEVVVAFAITKDGSISSLHVTKPSGYPILDEAAIKIIQKAAAKFPAIPDTIDKQSMDYVVPILFKERRG